jgi:hypothetical protein
LGAYAGLALVRRASGEYRLVDGQIQRSAQALLLRG